MFQIGLEHGVESNLHANGPKLGGTASAAAFDGGYFGPANAVEGAYKALNARYPLS